VSLKEYRSAQTCLDPGSPDARRPNSYCVEECIDRSHRRPTARCRTGADHLSRATGVWRGWPRALVRLEHRQHQYWSEERWMAFDALQLSGMGCVRRGCLPCIFERSVSTVGRWVVEPVAEALQPHLAEQRWLRFPSQFWYKDRAPSLWRHARCFARKLHGQITRQS
jgi:hypothetical protein